MAETGGQKKRSKTKAGKQIAEFVTSLSKESRMLVALKTQLYGDSWEPMLDDLKNRLNGKPYIFKLASRIQDDINRIEEMAEFEEKLNIDLADHVDIP